MSLVLVARAEQFHKLDPQTPAAQSVGVLISGSARDSSRVSSLGRNGVRLIPRPFFVGAYFECPMGASEKKRIPPHRLLIEPLVAATDEILVFQNPKYPIEVPMPPHNDLKRGRYQLDQIQTVVRGWERFWNAGAWRRGAITLRLERGSIDWKDLFLWTEYGGIWSSRHQIKKGTPTSAITYCDKNAVNSTVVVSLTASNGIQLLDIWSDASACMELHEQAQATCRNFVREVDTGKFPREIVYNVPTYRDLI